MAPDAGPGAENVTPAQPTNIGTILCSHFGQPGAPRAQSAVTRVILGSCDAKAQSTGLGADNAIIAPLTTIRLVSGSLGRQGHRTLDHKQKKQRLRSLEPLGAVGQPAKNGCPK